MSQLLALPVRREAGGVMPFLKDYNGEVMFVGDGYHVEACVIAINSHDALTARVAELEAEVNNLNDIKSLIIKITDSKPVISTKKYNSNIEPAHDIGGR
jgi:uncharacterized protein YegP (UPF0339 family)